ncbi:hypothetical protein ACIHEI_33955 [Kitasatospora sp. NPDC051984]|uniref:hypothetical protein n=1 Tax=Kitasatospora sp. NPDC051984 TaxID=3364059 RepID=UPI0037C5FB70
MSDHSHHADASGQPGVMLPLVHELLSDTLMIPATAVTGLLRAIATSWTASPCPACQKSAPPYAAFLAGVADHLDLECIAAAEQFASPTD